MRRAKPGSTEATRKVGEAADAILALMQGHMPEATPLDAALLLVWSTARYQGVDMETIAEVLLEMERRSTNGKAS